MSASLHLPSQSLDDSLNQSQAIAKALRTLQDKLDASEAENRMLQAKLQCIQAESALHKQLRQQQQRIEDLELLLRNAGSPESRLHPELEQALRQLRSSEAARSYLEQENSELRAELACLKSELTQSKQLNTTYRCKIDQFKSAVSHKPEMLSAFAGTHSRTQPRTQPRARENLTVSELTLTRSMNDSLLNTLLEEESLLCSLKKRHKQLQTRQLARSSSLRKVKRKLQSVSSEIHQKSMLIQKFKPAVYKK